jgi:hypothetical protein
MSLTGSSVFQDERSRIYHTGRKAGFFLGFVVFFSSAYLLLSFQHKVPSGIEYPHFLLAALVLASFVLLIRRNER